MDPKGTKLFVPLKRSPHKEKHYFLKFFYVKNKINKMITFIIIIIKIIYDIAI